MILVIGRFLKAVAGLVQLRAGLARVTRRQFLIWNIAGCIRIALAHLTIGFLLGDVMGRIWGSLTRVALLVGVIALLFFALRNMLYTALRLLPLAWTTLLAALRNLANIPVVRRRIWVHPEGARLLSARVDSTGFSGLTLSLVVPIFLYFRSVRIDSAIDFVRGDPVVKTDIRLAQLIHHFQSLGPIRFASPVTDVGNWQVVLPVVPTALIRLFIVCRLALAARLEVLVIENMLSVALLNLSFLRPVSLLGSLLRPPAASRQSTLRRPSRPK